jgi:hypothetical protein
LDEEEEARPQAKHHQRMAVEAIGNAAQSGRREILAHRERSNVADTAALEIPRAGVMRSMAAPPVVVWRQCQHADDAADPVVGLPRSEKGAVTAIMLDHEEAHQKAGSRHRQREAQPVAPAQAYPRADPQ